MNCEICNEKISTSLTQGDYLVHFCKKCRHSFANKQTSKTVEYSVYDNYEFSLKKLRNTNFNIILSKMRKLVPENAVGLEIGSALGWFLQECAAVGYAMTGIEPIKINYERSLSNDEYTVINGFFPECLPDEQYKEHFDFIIFNDVFEHIPDINRTLTACSELLKDSGGYLIINLPVNTGIFFRAASWLALIGKPKSLIRLWQFETESPHLHYFSGKSLIKSCSKEGFSLVKRFGLKTVIFDIKNMRKRVEGIGNPGKIRSILITLLVLLGIPLLKLLPKDTKCFVFHKGGDK